MRVLKFSAVGGMFGCGAVFSFLAQDALSPGSYALYAQSGVVIVPIIWRFTFQKPIPVLTWIHIGIIALGIFAYRVSEIDLDHMFDGIGLMWVMLKVLMAGLGSVVAELLLKQDTALPFTVRLGRNGKTRQDTARLTVTEVAEVAEVAEELCPVC
ncbi:unnamed protein product [Effrenium voratum]|nr:unnamed protein product [Effrenium voratum]